MRASSPHLKAVFLHASAALGVYLGLQIAVGRNLVKAQGVGALYKGLSAGLLRQATYTTARLGLYNNIFEAAKKHNDNKVGGFGLDQIKRGGGDGAVLWRCCCRGQRHGPLNSQFGGSAVGLPAPWLPELESPVPSLCSGMVNHSQRSPRPILLQPLPLWQKAACGLTAGGLGALVGSPADLSLIRMQADTQLPAAERRNYKNAFDALARIVREEGVAGLFTGAGPTVVRAMALNMGMLASNEQVRRSCVRSFAGRPSPGKPHTAAAAWPYWSLWATWLRRPRGSICLLPPPRRPAPYPHVHPTLGGECTPTPRPDPTSPRPPSCRPRRHWRTWALPRAATRWCWAAPALPASSPPPARCPLTL